VGEAGGRDEGKGRRKGVRYIWVNLLNNISGMIDEIICIIFGERIYDYWIISKVKLSDWKLYISYHLI